MGFISGRARGCLKAGFHHGIEVWQHFSSWRGFAGIAISSGIYSRLICCPTEFPSKMLLCCSGIKTLP